MKNVRGVSGTRFRLDERTDRETDKWMDAQMDGRFHFYSPSSPTTGDNNTFFPAPTFAVTSPSHFGSGERELRNQFIFRSLNYCHISVPAIVECPARIFL